VLAQQLNELGGLKRAVPHLHRVPQPAVSLCGGDGAPVKSLVVLGRQPCSLASGTRKQREERGETVGIKAQSWRQLPEDRPQLVAQKQ
jgi:hypothetical protein